jgi:hypothetical protein
MPIPSCLHAALAEKERALISARTKAALTAKKANRGGAWYSSTFKTCVSGNSRATEKKPRRSGASGDLIIYQAASSFPQLVKLTLVGRFVFFPPRFFDLRHHRVRQQVHKR